MFSFKLAEAFVEVGVKDGPMSQGLTKAKGMLGAALAQMKAMAASAAGALLPAAIGVGLVAAMREAVMGAGDLAETLSKVDVVFGDAAGRVKSFAKSMRDDFGSSEQSILDAAAGFGLIGKASGLAQGPAAEMSVTLARLADDASSFYNVPLEEALLTIKSALVGEAEPIRRFGVLLNEAAVQNEALRLGLVKSKNELTEATKVQARYSLILKGMADAQGDHARTAGSFSNQVREMIGRLKNLGVSLGKTVLPVFNLFLRVLNPIASALEFVAEKVEGVGAAVGRMFSALSSFSLADLIEGPMPAAPEIAAPTIAKPKGLAAGMTAAADELGETVEVPAPAGSVAGTPGVKKKRADMTPEERAREQLRKEDEADRDRVVLERIRDEERVAKKRRQLQEADQRALRESMIQGRMEQIEREMARERARARSINPVPSAAEREQAALYGDDPERDRARLRRAAEAEQRAFEKAREAKGIGPLPDVNFDGMRDKARAFVGTVILGFEKAREKAGELKQQGIKAFASGLNALHQSGAEGRFRKEQEKSFRAEVLDATSYSRRLQEGALNAGASKEEKEIAKNTAEANQHLKDAVGALGRIVFAWR